MMPQSANVDLIILKRSVFLALRVENKLHQLKQQKLMIKV